MEQCNPFDWIYYSEEESRMDLQATIIAAQQEIMKLEEELIHMKDLLMMTIKERDEAQSIFHKFMLEKLLLEQQSQQQQHEKPLTLTVAVSLSNTNTTTNYISPATSQQPQIAVKLVATNRRPLPEKGKLLKAVMEAGPLLQTLLLAGPLPQWKHQPPRLESIEIPPVTIRVR